MLTRFSRDLALEQSLATGLFIDIVGRGIEIKDKPGTRGGGILERAIFPEILTHGNTDGLAFNVEHQRVGTFGEIALFVKNLVVRREAFEVATANLTGFNHQRRVI